MIRKKWIALVMVMILWLMTGVAWAVVDQSSFEDEHLAAPAVAGLLLEEAGIDNRYGQGRDGGNFIRDVAHEMGSHINDENGTDFWGISKCDVEAYKIAVGAFLLRQGASILDGQVIWLDASEYDEAAGRWKDKSGEGNDAKQDDPNKKPKLMEGELNHLSVVRFDGESNVLTADVDNNLFSNEKGITVFAVVLTPGGTGSIMGQYSVANNTRQWHLGSVYADDSKPGFTAQSSATSFNSNQVASMTSYPDGFNIWTGYWTPDQASKFRLNGVEEIAASIKTANITVLDNPEPLEVGGMTATSGGPRYLNGDIAEILIYDRALYDNELEMVEAYLTAKYAL